MSREEIFNKVVQLIANYFEIDAASITGETNIINDLSADSISIMEFVLAMEDEFEIEISDEDAENISTVNEIVDHLQSALK
ncbi:MULTISPECIES: acyl carrier protein [unclassified Enterococcus]|uniref:acyl carrier protein n=1 Tax=unclassified Enterococcus TaxID=2608891 RepID=UPI001556DA6A|nr:MULTISPECIES: acyl carrier protein [unclassified Enterococcus]MBS7576979.1 acyl carrier protein [Enterococcus sp. MMGLQ5-2]MBS7584386.1 acyl carrier protein [Enterococcus sp. MMGLQ5-1]NPD12241.1 acyl carrier protein [Enterococcus sp. MMGLQ5-1]NPD36813.1 acyl carrier protein [Enterococcus sp. MMGLQ5-2]